MQQVYIINKPCMGLPVISSSEAIFVCRRWNTLSLKVTWCQMRKNLSS